MHYKGICLVKKQAEKLILWRLSPKSFSDFSGPAVSPSIFSKDVVSSTYH